MTWICIGQSLLQSVSLQILTDLSTVFFFFLSVSTKRSDHPVQAQALRLSGHLCRWSGKQAQPLFKERYFETKRSEVFGCPRYHSIKAGVLHIACPTLFLSHTEDNGQMDVRVHGGVTVPLPS